MIPTLCILVASIFVCATGCFAQMVTSPQFTFIGTNVVMLNEPTSNYQLVNFTLDSILDDSEVSRAERENATDFRYLYGFEFARLGMSLKFCNISAPNNTLKQTHAVLNSIETAVSIYNNSGTTQLLQMMDSMRTRLQYCSQPQVWLVGRSSYHSVHAGNRIFNIYGTDSSPNDLQTGTQSQYNTADGVAQRSLWGYYYSGINNMFNTLTGESTMRGGGYQCIGGSLLC
jgi:hypothetical protein